MGAGDVGWCLELWLFVRQANFCVDNVETFNHIPYILIMSKQDSSPLNVLSSPQDHLFLKWPISPQCENKHSWWPLEAITAGMRLLLLGKLFSQSVNKQNVSILLCLPVSIHLCLFYTFWCMPLESQTHTLTHSLRLYPNHHGREDQGWWTIDWWSSSSPCNSWWLASHFSNSLGQPATTHCLRVCAQGFVCLCFFAADWWNSQKPLRVTVRTSDRWR